MSWMHQVRGRCWDQRKKQRNTFGNWSLNISGIKTHKKPYGCIKITRARGVMRVITRGFWMRRKSTRTAFHTLWTVSPWEGQRLYRLDYRIVSGIICWICKSWTSILLRKKNHNDWVRYKCSFNLDYPARKVTLPASATLITCTNGKSTIISRIPSRFSSMTLLTVIEMSFRCSKSPSTISRIIFGFSFSAKNL